MNYEEKLEKLFNRFPSYQKVGARAYKPGIESMTALDNALGNPHRRFKTIHIAGTNGKGSVSSFMAAACSSVGLRTGLYCSPHLADFRERIKIVEGGRCHLIPKEAVESFLDNTTDLINEISPSFFEITTAMAFDWFAKQQVDIAVIETGLGGRLDSTNIITPQLSIITNIGLEHCSMLGYTLEEIAFEKGGIIKPGVPCIIGEENSHTRPIFEKIAAKHNAPIIFAQHTDISDYEIDPELLDLKGFCQMQNIRTVAAALKTISIPPSKSLRQALYHTAQITALRGRWEKIEIAGAPCEVRCDIGHNAHGLSTVFSQLAKQLEVRNNIYIVFGVVNDKDIDAVAPLMLPPSDRVHYILTSPSTPRRMEAEVLAAKLAAHGLVADAVVPKVSEAVKKAFALANEQDLIFIGGSNFTVADVICDFGC